MSSPDDAAPAWPGLHAARVEAATRGSSSVGTQHVLLALLTGADDAALRALRAAGVNLSTAGAALEAITGIGGVRRAHVEPDDAVDTVPVSPRVERILSDAAHHRPAPGDAPEDADVLRALLSSDDPSIGRLVVTYIGSPEEILAALDDEPAASGS